LIRAKRKQTAQAITKRNANVSTGPASVTATLTKENDSPIISAFVTAKAYAAGIGNWELVSEFMVAEL